MTVVGIWNNKRCFEVVTAVLGDQGQTPQRDFLILTAISDRQNERFYTTLELLEFCHRFRLPHNDIWTYTTINRHGTCWTGMIPIEKRGILPIH
jgi:hypothetical protein